MAHIHPTAIVDRQAELASDVEVGPGCVIEGPVVIEQGCRLRGHVYLCGRVTLGRGNTLYPFVCVGFEPQHRQFQDTVAGVVIGDRNVLRESVTVHGATQTGGHTTIGDDNYLMTNAHVGHDVVVGDHCTLASGALLGGHVQIQDGVFVGGNAGIHQFCKIGRLAFVGAVGLITKDLPPFALSSGNNRVVGLNLVGLRRHAVERPAIDAVNAAFKTLYLSGHTNSVAVERIEATAAQGGSGAELLTELVVFIRQSTRGLVSHMVTSRPNRLREAHDASR